MSAAPQNVHPFHHLPAKAFYGAEQDVIAGCVLRPDRMASLSLEPKHFSDGPHRELWETLLAMHAEGEPIDTVTVAERLREVGYEQNVAYLIELVQTCLDSNFEHKAQIVYRRSQQIDLWRQIERAMHTKDEATIVRVAEEITSRLALGSKRAVMAPVDVAYQSMMDEWAASRERPKLTWGLRDLDRWVKPMQPTRLHVVMARPGMGKTALALNVAIANALAGKKVGIISLEQSMEELTARMLCILAACPIDWINGEDPQVPPNYVQRIDEAKRTLRGLPILINDATPMSIGQLQSFARSMVQRYGSELLIVDYLQKIGGEAKERHMEVAKVAMGLKDIARQHKVPVLALAQAKRDAEGKRPTMSDLRDSGFIEQEADLILALHREESDDENRSDVTEILVLKNRHGKARMCIKTVYRGECFRFDEYEGRYAPQ